MVSNPRKGRELEYKVRDMYRMGGYTVFRCAASKPLDLVAVKGDETILIEVKTRLPPTSEFERLKKIAAEADHSIKVISYADGRPHGWTVYPDSTITEDSD